jgi:hypothetical protein
MSNICCGVYCQLVQWLSLLVAPGIVAEIWTADGVRHQPLCIVGRWWSWPRNCDGGVALLKTTVDGHGTGVCPMTVVAMAAEGHRCDTCAWTFWPCTDVDQHNFGLLYRTLLDAFARLTPEFQRFRDMVISNSSKKGKSRLKQELKSTPQVGLPF